MDALNDELQKVMAERFDTEFAQTWGLILKAYGIGVEDGRSSARTEIINLIKGENK